MKLSLRKEFLSWETLYGGQFTLFNRLLKPNFQKQILQKVTPFFHLTTCYIDIGNKSS